MLNLNRTDIVYHKVRRCMISVSDLVVDDIFFRYGHWHRLTGVLGYGVEGQPIRYVYVTTEVSDE